MAPANDDAAADHQRKQTAQQAAARMSPKQLRRCLVANGFDATARALRLEAAVQSCGDDGPDGAAVRCFDWVVKLLFLCCVTL
jgi:hypothetical protein